MKYITVNTVNVPLKCSENTVIISFEWPSEVGNSELYMIHKLPRCDAVKGVKHDRNTDLYITHI